MPEAAFTTRFERALESKKRQNSRLAEAVIRTVELLLTDPRTPGLNVHRLDGPIREAYVNDAARLTFQREGDALVFRNNCSHRIIERRQF